MSAASTAIVIAAYNAQGTLERAVSSALAQPEAVEIFVVDDCSQDGTAELAERLARADARIRVLSTARNAGPGAARNIAIEAASAPWIALLDADDYMIEGRLAALHRIAGDADFIADALLRTGEDARPPLIAPSLSPTSLDFTSFVLGNLGAQAGPLDLGYLKPIMRRAFLQAHGLRYREDMRLGEDYELYARALALGARFFTCEPAGYVSIERDGSLSRAHSELDLQRLRDCDEGIAAVRRLTPEEQRALRRHWTSVDCRLQWRRLISAVKQRDVGAAISTFRSPETAAFLAVRLGEQAWLRSTAFGRTGA